MSDNQENKHITTNMNSSISEKSNIKENEFLLYSTKQNFVLKKQNSKILLNINKTVFSAEEYDAELQNIINKSNNNSSKNSSTSNPKVNDILNNTEVSHKDSISIKALIGVIKILGFPHFIVVSKSKLISKFIEKTIYLIKEVQLIGCYSNKPSDKVRIEIEETKSQITKLMKIGFYYSFDFDLTNKLQYQDNSIKTLDIPYNINDKSANKYALKFADLNSHFFYNKNMLKPFIQNTSSESYIMQWFPVLLYGHIETKSFKELNSFANETNNKNKEINILIISRRSSLSASKFTGKQGLTNNGYVSNFIETEQIVYTYNNQIIDLSSNSIEKREKQSYKISSTIIVSSSPQIFYSVNSETKDITINKHPLSTKASFEAFFSRTLLNYKNIFLINSINYEDINDQIILQSHEKVIENVIPKYIDNLKYLFFNFTLESHEIDDSVLINIEDSLIPDIKNIISYFNNFQYDSKLSFVSSAQLGTFYITNTKDLNIVGSIASVVGFYSFISSLKYFDINLESFLNEFGNSNKIILSIINCKENNIVLSSFKSSFFDAWNNTYTVLNMQYSTSLYIGPNKKLRSNTFQTRNVFNNTNSMTFNNYNKESSNIIKSFDLKVQSLILKILSGESNFYTMEEYKKRLSSLVYLNNTNYSDELKLRIHCCTFNSGAKEPKDKYPEIKLFFRKYRTFNKSESTTGLLALPDLFVFGFQEIIDLNAMNLLILSNSSVVDKWKNFLEKELKDLVSYTNNQYTLGYQLIHSSNLVGICAFVFAKKEILPNISNTDSLILRLGFKGLLGNKGSLIFRFDYYLTSIAIICCHLEAGDKKMKERLEQIKSIFNSKLISAKEEFNHYKNEIQKFSNLDDLLYNYDDDEDTNTSSYKDFRKLRTFEANVFRTQTQTLDKMSSIKATFGSESRELNMTFNEYSSNAFLNNNNNNQLNSPNKNTSIEDMYEKLFKQKVTDHDVVIFFGDLNFRVEMKYDDCLNCIKQNKIYDILREDQFTKCGSFCDLTEGIISFKPSYKFNKNSTEYTTKKMRTPSYCDRILFKKNFAIKDQINVVEYNYIPEVGMSDHKPVYSIFDVKVFKENSAKKNEFKQSCSQKVKYLIEDEEDELFNESEFVEDKEIMINYKLCELEEYKSRNKSYSYYNNGLKVEFKSNKNKMT